MAWQFYEWAKDQPVRPAPRKLILLLIADHADIDTRCAYPSLSYLAIESGLSERQVHDHLKKLATVDNLVRIEKVTSKRGRFEYNRYWLLGSKEDFAPYFAADKPYLKARAALAGERSEAAQDRPANGSLLPLEAALANGSAASPPTEAWRPGQRKRASVKPQKETEKTGAKQSFERSGSSSLAPRRAAAIASASAPESTSRPPKVHPRGRPVKNPTRQQKALAEASGYIDRLGDTAVAAALNSFADRCPRVVEWAHERTLEHAKITDVDGLTYEEYWAYQRHVYFWCMKNFVATGNWPPELLEPLRAVAGAA